jgi:hypothetical protein
MSARMAWAFIDLLSGERPVQVSPAELTRLRHRIQRLKSVPQPADLMRSWLPRRAELRKLSIAEADVPVLGSDPRIVVSGISDRRSGMSAAGEFEGYVAGAGKPKLGCRTVTAA